MHVCIFVSLATHRPFIIQTAQSRVEFVPVAMCEGNSSVSAVQATKFLCESMDRSWPFFCFSSSSSSLGVHLVLMCSTCVCLVWATAVLRNLTKYDQKKSCLKRRCGVFSSIAVKLRRHPLPSYRWVARSHWPISVTVCGLPSSERLHSMWGALATTTTRVGGTLESALPNNILAYPGFLFVFWFLWQMSKVYRSSVCCFLLNMW